VGSAIQKTHSGIEGQIPPVCSFGNSGGDIIGDMCYTNGSIGAPITGGVLFSLRFPHAAVARKIDNRGNKATMRIT